jgi:hypothetical protein
MKMGQAVSPSQFHDYELHLRKNTCLVDDLTLACEASNAIFCFLVLA